MNHNNKIWITFTGIIIVFFLISCGGGEAQPAKEEGSQAQDGSADDSSSGESTQEMNTSGAEFEEASLPVDFPESFPIPEGARIGSSVVEPGLDGFRITISVITLMDESLAYYQRELPLAGWTITGFEDTSRGTEMSLSHPEFEGELLFISLETGVVIDVALHLPGEKQDIPGSDEAYGETAELGEGGGDFPADFPVPLGAEPINVPDKLKSEGFQLAFSYPDLPEMAYIQMITGFMAAGWDVGEFVIDAESNQILMPFTDPASGFQGYAMMTDDPNLIGMNLESGSLIALHEGVP